MSIEVYRVPLDFDWPLKRVWEGYVMPVEIRGKPCLSCEETGLSPAAKVLHDRWYGYAPFRPEDRGSTPFLASTPAVREFAERNVERAPEFYGSGELVIQIEAQRLADLWNERWSHHLNQDDVDALVAAERLHDLTHRWDAEAHRWVATGYVPTPAEVNTWSVQSLGHDSINQWVVVKAECQRLGIAPECPSCAGHGSVYRDDSHRKAEEDWTRTDPPSGEGWQMWETTSEGSPMSPVFASSEELANWLTTTGASAFAGRTATYDEWLGMIVGTGHSIASMVLTENGFETGVAAASHA